MIDFTKTGTLHTRGIFVVAGAAGLLILATVGLSSQPRVSEQAAKASFEKDGEVDLPANYRQWAHVGSRYKVGGMNILDGTPVKIPQVLDTYVEPSAMAHYKGTGKWPEGAQIVKELIEVKGGKDCDSTTFFCSTPLGSGIFEENYIGVGMMVKDSKRFPEEPGNWAYFAFFHKTSAYDRTARERPREQCASCHVKLASESDYVIVKAHLGLLPGKIQ